MIGMLHLKSLVGMLRRNLREDEGEAKKEEVIMACLFYNIRGFMAPGRSRQILESVKDFRVISCAYRKPLRENSQMLI
jgi:hypothetical protein